MPCHHSLARHQNETWLSSVYGPPYRMYPWILAVYAKLSPRRDRAATQTFIPFGKASCWAALMTFPLWFFSHLFGVDRVETAVMFCRCGPSILRFVWFRMPPLPSSPLTTEVLNCFCRQSVSLNKSCQSPVTSPGNFAHTFGPRRRRSD